MGAWTSAGLQPTTGYYPYDPALAAYGYVTIAISNYNINGSIFKHFIVDFFRLFNLYPLFIPSLYRAHLWEHKQVVFMSYMLFYW